MSIRLLWIVAGIFLFPALVESAAIIQKVSGIPPGFEPNRGQAPAPARYLLRGGGVYLTPDSMLVTPIQVGFRFVSASASATETASEQLPGLVNVLRGSSASAWHTGIPRYGRVEFQQIYPGISVAYTIREKQLICQLTLAPGADLSAVKLEALGVQNINGTATSITLWFSRLVTYPLNGLTAYVTGSSERVSVPARFRLNGGNTFQLEMDAPSTESQREIEFTVLGGFDQSPSKDVVAGPSGSIYLAGALAAMGVGGTVGVGGNPTPNALDPALEICSWTMPMPTPCSDAYVAKFNAAGELA